MGGKWRMAEVQVGKGKGGGRRKPVIIAPQRAGMRIALAAVGSVLTALIGFFFMLPPLNFRAPEFYFFLILVFGSFAVFLFLLSRTSKQPEYMPWVRKKATPAIAIVLVIALFFGVAWVFSSPLFLARRYHNIMPVQELTFAEEIDEVDFDLVPKIDEAAARVIAEATLSALIDVVSQFTLSQNSTQIVYDGRPVRVFPLAYVDVVRWLLNTSDGLPGFVMVYMDTQESEFHWLEDNMRYTDEEHFFRLLGRHLRFRFPTYLLGPANFEIDDDRNPYWVVPRMNRTVGLVGGEDVIGVILVNAVTGEIEEFSIEDVPEWVNRVYNATLINTQFSWFGRFGRGFWNSLLGQQGVWQSTPGYNYLIQRNDVYVYSGVSAAGGAEDSIIGFMLVNQRTREAHFYQTSGATEAFAQHAAQGAVQHMGWRATHPLLINITNQPTYFMALKDNNNIVQGFAMTNVERFTTINVWAYTLDVCLERYIAALQDHGLDVEAPEPPAQLPGDELPPADAGTSGGTIADIRMVVINNNTNLLVRLQGTAHYYRLALTQTTLHAALLNVGDEVTVTYTPGATGDIIAASNISAGIAEEPVEEPPYEEYTEE